MKLSGEALGGPDGAGLDTPVLKQYAEEIAQVVRKGTQVAIVVGGGNIFRGAAGCTLGFERVQGDRMGMLATVINSIALSQFIKEEGIPAEVFTSLPMEPTARYYTRDNAVAFMEKGGVALIAGGTGNPFFTTDSAAALRACEISADALLKGTKVDGVYDSDPKKNPSAVKFTTITYAKALADNLRVMDQTAFALCRENGMTTIVYDSTTPGNLNAIVDGKAIGTTVTC